MRIRKIEVTFPVSVDLPLGWEQALDALVNMICKKYEAEHPTRTTIKRLAERGVNDE